jgi:hypothetical protein
MSTHTDG